MPREAQKYSYNGQRLTVRELAALPDCAVDYYTLSARLSTMWGVTTALKTPKMSKSRAARRSKPFRDSKPI
jgi:hypothetical protein